MKDKKEEIFKPNITMIYYWRAYADPYIKPTRADAAREAVRLMTVDSVDPKKIPEAESIRKATYLWENEEDYPGYKEWVREQWSKLMAEAEPMLDKIGIQRGVKDFKYWEAMQMKYTKFKRKTDVTTNDRDIASTKSIADGLQAILNGKQRREENQDSRDQQS